MLTHRRDIDLNHMSVARLHAALLSHQGAGEGFDVWCHEASAVLTDSSGFPAEGSGDLAEGLAGSLMAAASWLLASMLAAAFCRAAGS